MCGIAGILLHEGANTRHLQAIEPMLATLHHRGPDGKGIWLDRESGVALGHRRLAIVDLSEAGHQPMLSESENLVITFNGEIYNFTALRPGLEARGHRFRGTSDTEVMLAAFETYGIEEALKQFSGMFAAAIWDRRHRVLHFVRDRMGKKPIYIALAEGALLFASELKALRASAQFSPAVDTRVLDAMLRQGWVPDQHCIWRNVFKLPPGTMLSVRAADLATATAESLRARARRWWSLAAIAETGQRQQLELDDDALDAELDWLLRTAVRQRMVADVPLGAFLSGGIDSSTVVALMQAQSPRPVRTFTIGFHDAQYDEAAYASQVARHFGCDHTEFRLTPAEVCAIIPELPRIWDEPFADESQIPTLLVSRLARQHVTVALTGDGGDECFGGYARHFMLGRFARLFELPPSARRLIASILLKLPPRAWEQIVHALPSAAAPGSAASGANLQKFARALGAADDQELYDRLTTFSASSVSLDPGVSDAPDMPVGLDAVGTIMYRDMAGYLTGDILVKLDRASMAASLEGRCPFLDDRIVEFAWRLPTAAKIRGGRGKWPLRRVLRRYLPESLFERPKQGFNVPIGEWLRGALREWAQELLEGDRIRRDGLLDPRRVQACWQQHLSGQADRSSELWAILMVQAWLDSIRDFRPTQAGFKSDESNSWATTWAKPQAPSLVSHGQGDRLSAYWPQGAAGGPAPTDRTALDRIDPAPAGRLSHDMQRDLR